MQLFEQYASKRIYLTDGERIPASKILDQFLADKYPRVAESGAVKTTESLTGLVAKVSISDVKVVILVTELDHVGWQVECFMEQC